MRITDVIGGILKYSRRITKDNVRPNEYIIRNKKIQNIFFEYEILLLNLGHVKSQSFFTNREFVY